jgi:molybdopterin-guanine dinucleotide biosynthesis protein A
MEQTIQISIHYFAGLRDATKKDLETITIRKGATAESVYQHLITMYNLPDINQLKVAINDSFASQHTEIMDGDKLVFIPPVTGG